MDVADDADDADVVGVADDADDNPYDTDNNDDMDGNQLDMDIVGTDNVIDNRLGKDRPFISPFLQAS